MSPKVASEPIKDEKGYYIFWVDEKFPRQEISFEDAKDNIRRFLLSEKARVAFLKRLDEEKKDSTIILNEKLKGMFNEPEPESDKVEGQ
jgi:parvulin-like peptidyl-prolyl isomerase